MRFIKRLFFILRPGFYIQNNPLSKEWDKMLNEFLDEPVIKAVDRYTVTLNGKVIWISNYPYAYGSPYGWAPEVRPRRDTIVRLRKLMDSHYFTLGKKP